MKHHLQYISRSNPLDAKRNGNTTFMFHSRSTCNAIYIERSNLNGMQYMMELRHSCFIVATHETSLTVRGATGVTLQHYQLLRLPRKMTFMLVILLKHESSIACHEILTCSMNPKIHELFRPIENRSETVPRPFRP